MFDRAIAISGMVLGVGMFAESSAPAVTDWSSWTALTAVIGALLFIVTKMLPDLHQKFIDQGKTFSEAIVKQSCEQSKTFADTISKQSSDFATSTKETQAKYNDTLDKIHDRATTAATTQAEELAKLRENCASRLTAK